MTVHGMYCKGVFKPKAAKGVFAAAANRFCHGGKTAEGLKNRLLFPFISMKGSGFAAFGVDAPLYTYDSVSAPGGV